MIRSWLRRLSFLLRRSHHDDDLHEEIETHRAFRAAELEREGLTPEEAANASRRALGNALLAREEAREVWLGSLGTSWQDLRYGMRQLHRNPAFTVAAVATVALGIGVNTGIFALVNAVLFRELTAPRAHELVSVSQAVQGVPDLAGQDTFSTSDYFAYRDRLQTLLGLAAYGNARGEATLGGDTPRKVLGALVSCNLFDVLQQPPALGRGLTAYDCEPDADLVIVLSHELWRTAFGADPGIVGRTVQLNRQQVTVAGVAADRAFSGTSFVQGGFLAPLSAGRRLASADSRYDDDAAAWLHLIGRRHENVGLEQVRAELRVIAAQIDREQPGRSTMLAVERARANDGLPSRLRGAAAVLVAAFGFILLIACANVANLLLARSTPRRHEIGIRMSLGASRVRVVRQLVTESVLLSLIGGLLGAAVAIASLQTLVGFAVPALLPPWLPLVLAIDVSPDPQLLLAVLALTVGTGILFGLAPALHASTPDLNGVLTHDSAAAGRRFRGGRLRAVLVGVQVALCMVLMIAAGLLLRGLHATYTIDPGFAYRDVLLISLESAFDGYSEEEAQVRRQRVTARLRQLPGIEAVASSDHKPLGDDRSPITIRLPEDARQSRLGEMTAVTEDHFSVLELPIVAGRGFTEQEVSGSRSGVGPRPAILTRTTAGNLWPDGDPVGRTLLTTPAGHAALAVETLQVVGVVADAQVTALGSIDPYHVYVPGDGAALLIKSKADLVTTMVPSVRAALQAIEPTLLVTVLPLEASLGWSRGISRLATTLFGGLGVLALVLASVGIYGVVSYVVTARYREIGVRLALGATARTVMMLILRQTLRPVVLGAVTGVAAALALSRVLASVLFGVSPVDPVGLGGAALLVLCVAVAAAVMAARPATRADLAAILRLQ